MRTSFAVAAGLLAVASAGTTTITNTVDVTITSCEPTVTNCPYKGGAGGDHTWSDWSVSASTTSSPAKVTSTSYAWDPNHTWSDWSDGASSTSSKPVSPATTSSYSGSWDHTWSDWTGSSSSSKPVSPASSSSYSWDPNHTWSDWASSTLATTATPVSAVTTAYGTGAWSSPVAAASTWLASDSATPVKPAVATYTGAANINAGSFALAGLAAAAALVIA